MRKPLKPPLGTIIFKRVAKILICCLGEPAEIFRRFNSTLFWQFWTSCPDEFTGDRRCCWHCISTSVRWHWGRIYNIHDSIQHHCLVGVWIRLFTGKFLSSHSSFCCCLWVPPSARNCSHQRRDVWSCGSASKEEKAQNRLGPYSRSNTLVFQELLKVF